VALATSLFKFDSSDMAAVEAKVSPKQLQPGETAKQWLDKQPLSYFQGKVKRIYFSPDKQCARLREFKERYYDSAAGIDPTTGKSVFLPGFWDTFDNVERASMRGWLSGEHESQLALHSVAVNVGLVLVPESSGGWPAGCRLGVGLASVAGEVPGRAKGCQWQRCSSTCLYMRIATCHVCLLSTSA
jgi:hypothetical protein